MKVIITTALLATAALTASLDAFASDERGKRQDRDRYGERHQHDDRTYHGRGYDRWGYRDDRMLRLRVPVHLNGSGEVRLRKLVRRHHGIDAHGYTLKKVVVHEGFGYRKARARLIVGEHSSPRVHLHPGRNHIRAPHGDGRWKLRLKHAHVRGVTVVLEPKHRHAQRHDHWRGKRHDRHHDRRWDDRYRDRDWWAWRGVRDWIRPWY